MKKSFDIEKGTSKVANYSTFQQTTVATPTYYGWLTCHLPSRVTVSSYLPSWKTIFYATTAVLITLPFVPYSLSDQPQLISMDWWRNLSLGQQLFTSLNAAAFFCVLVAARLTYLPKMVAALGKIFSQCCLSLGHLINTNTIIALALTAAIPMTAIGYYGSISFGSFIAVFAALASFMAIASLRIVFLVDCVSKISNVFNEDRQYQQSLISQLKQFNKDEIVILNDALQQQFSDIILDEHAVKKILKYLRSSENTITPHQSSVFNDIKYYISLGLDNGLGLYLGIAFFLFSGEAGYQGVKLLCALFSENCQFDDLAYTLKMAIAVITAASSFVAAYLGGSELLPFTSHVYQHLKETPSHIPRAILATICCLLTAVPLANAANSFLSKDNLFSLTPHHALSLPYYIGNYMVSLAFDGKPAFEICGLTNTMTKDLTVNKLVLWLEKNPLPKTSLSAIKKTGFFNVKPVHTKEVSPNLHQIKQHC